MVTSWWEDRTWHEGTHMEGLLESLIILCIYLGNKCKGACLVTTHKMVLEVKNLPANAGNMIDMGYIPVLGKSPGKGDGNPPQYSCQGPGKIPWAEEPGRLQSSSVQLLSRVWLFATPRTAAHHVSLSITKSWSSFKFMSICLFLLLFPIFWEVGHRGSFCDVCQRVFCLCSPLGVL